MLDKKVFELREQDEIYKKRQELERERDLKIRETNKIYQEKFVQLQNKCNHVIDGLSALKDDGHPYDTNSRKRFCVICCKHLEI